MMNSIPPEDFHLKTEKAGIYLSKISQSLISMLHFAIPLIIPKEREVRRETERQI